MIWPSERFGVAGVGMSIEFGEHTSSQAADRTSCAAATHPQMSRTTEAPSWTRYHYRRFRPRDHQTHLTKMGAGCTYLVQDAANLHLALSELLRLALIGDDRANGLLTER